MIEEIEILEDPKQSMNGVKSKLETKNERVHQAVSKDNHFFPGLILFNDLPADGRSLYRAVGFYCGETQQWLRRFVAMHLENQQNVQIRQAIKGLLKPKQSIEQYIQDIRDGKEWADDLEIEVLMRVLDRPIFVLGSNKKIINLDSSDRFKGEPIFVFYNGNTYNALILTGDSNSRDVLEGLKKSMTQVKESPQLKQAEEVLEAFSTLEPTKLKKLEEAFSTFKMLALMEAPSTKNIQQLSYDPNRYLKDPAGSVKIPQEQIRKDGIPNLIAEISESKEGINPLHWCRIFGQEFSTLDVNGVALIHPKSPFMYQVRQCLNEIKPDELTSDENLLAYIIAANFNSEKLKQHIDECQNINLRNLAIYKQLLTSLSNVQEVAAFKAISQQIPLLQILVNLGEEPKPLNFTKIKSLAGVNFDLLQLPNESDFSECDLTGAYCRGLDSFKIKMNGAQCAKINFESACLQKIQANGANLSGGYFVRADLYEGSFVDANCKGAVFCQDYSATEKTDGDRSWSETLHERDAVRLIRANFTGADLDGADLSYTDCQYTKFPDASMIEIKLNRAKCGGADFNGAIMKGARISHTSFYCATCIGTNFSKAYINHLNVQDVQFVGTIFSGATIKEVNFHQANKMEGVSFRGATLIDVDLDHHKLNVDCTGATLKRVKLPYASEKEARREGKFEGAIFEDVIYMKSKNEEHKGYSYAI